MTLVGVLLVLILALIMEEGACVDPGTDAAIGTGTGIRERMDMPLTGWLSTHSGLWLYLRH